MSFRLTGVFENATTECGDSVGVNPQVPNLMKEVSCLSMWWPIRRVFWSSVSLSMHVISLHKTTFRNQYQIIFSVSVGY